MQRIKDDLLKTFRGISLYKIVKFPIVILYEYPRDYPEYFVARLFDGNRATKYIVLGKSLDEILNKIPQHMVKFLPDIKDDKVIKEIYI